MFETEKGSTSHPAPARRKRWTATSLAGLALIMVGLSFAAVPLYRMFCEVTGSGGTTQVAKAAPEQSEQRITVRFDANVAAGMPWMFEAPKPVELALGQTGLVTYKARNPTSRSVLGTATFNVTPERAGIYFNKIQCFCFTEQLLMPGEEKELPVTFFVDPAIEKDRDLKAIATITLSYTFFDKGPEALKTYMASRAIKAAEFGGDINVNRDAGRSVYRRRPLAGGSADHRSARRLLAGSEAGPKPQLSHSEGIRHWEQVP